MTPTLSAAAVQPRLTWLLPAAVALSPDGALGGVVSGAVVLTVTILEIDGTPFASMMNSMSTPGGATFALAGAVA